MLLHFVICEAVDLLEWQTFHSSKKSKPSTSKKIFLRNRHRKGEGGGGWDVGVPAILKPKTRYFGVRTRSFFLLHFFLACG